MCLEVTLYLKKQMDFKSDELVNHVTELLKSVTTDLEKNNFSFKATKK
jgi:hypothetical protein